MTGRWAATWLTRAATTSPCRPRGVGRGVSGPDPREPGIGSGDDVANRTGTTDKRAIRARRAEGAEAIRARDLDGSPARHAPDIVSFDVVGPLRFVGREEVKQRAAGWFSSSDGRIDDQLRDLSSGEGRAVAFGHSRDHGAATTVGGENVDLW